ncbi:MAG: chorismate-binding protein, partial [Muribaculaceae bacterium]|nr:chorismate-binding protein [Muribaculaceae bacterium]
GYVAINSTNEFVAYVNLRCVSFDHNRWCMYVGSGIMPDSDINDEWLETEAKAHILKRLIEDSHK